MACGVVAGLAVLFNSTVVPGVAVVVCAALIDLERCDSFRQGVRWAATAGAAALAVCAWWLVPVRSRLGPAGPLDRPALGRPGFWRYLANRRVGGPGAASRRVGGAHRLRSESAVGAGSRSGVVATLLADLFNYLRPERWLALPDPGCCMRHGCSRQCRFEGKPHGDRRTTCVDRDRTCVLGHHCRDHRPLRSAFPLHDLASLAGRGVAGLRLVRWLGSGFFSGFRSEPNSPSRSRTRVEGSGSLGAAGALDSSGSGGLVYLDGLYNTAAGDVGNCRVGTSVADDKSSTDGRIRPLFGLYRETSHAAEFLDAEFEIRSGAFEVAGGRRPHWFDTWQIRGGRRLLGYRCRCGGYGRPVVCEL